MNRAIDSIMRFMRKEAARQAAIPGAMLLMCVLAVCSSCRHEPDSAHGENARTLSVASASFANGAAIPPRYTCDGADVSPELHWPAGPEGAKSFALVMHDPDAGIDFTHWIAFNISPGAGSLEEGASGRPEMPQGSAEGINGFGRHGYSGPCPPGGKAHRYVFEIYALDARLDAPAGATRNDFDRTIERHILAEGQMKGTYRRSGR